MPTATAAPAFSKPTTVNLLGGEVTTLVPAASTGDQWSLMLYVAPAGLPGPVPHIHREVTETFTVLEGTMTFSLDGETRTLGPGESVVVPPLVTHHFRNLGDETCRMLVHFTPGGMEGYFGELADFVAASEGWPPADLAPLIALMGRYDSFAVR